MLQVLARGGGGSCGGGGNLLFPKDPSVLKRCVAFATAIVFDYLYRLLAVVPRNQHRPYRITMAVVNYYGCSDLQAVVFLIWAGLFGLGCTGPGWSGGEGRDTHTHTHTHTHTRTGTQMRACTHTATYTQILHLRLETVHFRGAKSSSILPHHERRIVLFRSSCLVSSNKAPRSTGQNTPKRLCRIWAPNVTNVEGWLTTFVSQTMHHVGVKAPIRQMAP